MQIRLTRRALLDIEAIEAASIARHGALATEQYLAKLELSLTTIGAHPGLLGKRGVSKKLRIYGSADHILVCAVIEETIYVTAVWYGSMNIEQKLIELEPGLVEEAEILHRRLQQSCNR